MCVNSHTHTHTQHETHGRDTRRRPNSRATSTGHLTSCVRSSRLQNQKRKQRIRFVICNHKHKDQISISILDNKPASFSSWIPITPQFFNTRSVENLKYFIISKKRLSLEDYYQNGRFVLSDVYLVAHNSFHRFPIGNLFC